MPAAKTKHKEEEEFAHDVITVFEWTAPGRPYKTRSKQYYLTALLIMLLLEIIAFLFSQYMLMLVILSLVFVAFALAYVPPKIFHYRISSEGLMIEDRFFLWQELYDFYFKAREGNETLHIRTNAYIPGELVITYDAKDKGKIKNALLPFLPFREYVKPNFMDRSADWLIKNFPLEKK